ncbi:hypothetical protein [Paractinoplanes toevensis]|uniref:Uncharacterized protein n=1 Tax=Paractinoplanes toevensis TaxID=571911 RepID=A0A919T7Y3_9ACTN|nr:hypothetical protein [Actinoplanes toevensis]GIM90087.1 hypothetical protein Ato02nite_018800 [Actinoplanes toevensis]
MVTEQEYTLLSLRARTSAAFADLQVVILRDLAARLKADGASADCAVRVDAAADQLEAAARQTWYALRAGETGTLMCGKTTGAERLRDQHRSPLACRGETTDQ